MSGYRQSSYEPNSWEPQGKPMRPYNWVQWTGIAICVTGGALAFYYLLGRLGWVPKLLDDVLPATSLMLIGVVLLNSRREPVPEDRIPELRRRQQRITIIALAVMAVAAVAGFAAAYYQGV